MLPSTAGDPDSFIGHCVNVINGDYCEAVTDAVVKGPDSLDLQRFYNAKNYMTGEGSGGWRIFSQHFLVIGRDIEKQSSTIDQKPHEKIYAFTGERSGSILTYSGWVDRDNVIKNPLKINLTNDGVGIVNTYSQLMSGQTDYKNNCLYIHGKTCEITLGDGTKRIYEKIKNPPTLFLGEELLPFMASYVKNAEYFHLIQETLPSGNHLIFSYESATGHLSSVELKNASQMKILSWMRFSYKSQGNNYLVTVSTSDERVVEYHLEPLKSSDKTYSLTKVTGSHFLPSHYQYSIHNDHMVLTKRSRSADDFIEIEYGTQGKVQAIKTPHPNSGKPEVSYTFTYGKGFTDVFNAVGTKTRYQFDDRFQLTAVEKYDGKGQLNRLDKKFWGKTEKDIGRLLATTISESMWKIHSYSCFQYDEQGNLIEEKLYGDLRGREEVLQVDGRGVLYDAQKLVECHRTAYTYSNDGYNLLTKYGDDSKTHTQYVYKQNTNLCIKELKIENQQIIKQILHEYNEDGVCVKSIEDDETEGAEATERYIKTIQPKSTLPGVGLPQVIEEKVFDRASKEEMLVKKLVNTFDAQGNLLCCDTYDAEGVYAYSESKEYNYLNLITAESNRLGQQVIHTYDANGRKISSRIPHADKEISNTYDFRNQLVETVERVGNLVFVTKNGYDLLGRAISVSDHFGNTTFYEYDAFGNQVKIVFPAVYDETQKVVNPTFSYEYDVFGNVTKIIDPKGNSVLKTYTVRGQLLKVKYSDGSSERFGYDLSGALTHTRSKDGIEKNFQFDNQKRITVDQTVHVDAEHSTFLRHKHNAFHCIESEDGTLVSRFKYKSGRLVKSTKFPIGKNENDDEARCTELTYDSLGRVCQKKIWFDTGSLDYTIEHVSYHPTGQISEKRIEDSSHATLLHIGFEYNSLGQCIEEYHFKNNEKIITKKNSYNALGEPFICSDGLGNEIRVDVDYAYFNSLGQKVVKKNVTSPLGVQTAIEFDVLARIVAITKKDPMGVLISSNQILYDTCGNKCVEIHDLVENGLVKGSKKIGYAYGSTGQLEAQIENYGSADEKKTTYSYNKKTQLISATIPGFSNPLSYKYHEAGNLEGIKWSGGKDCEEVADVFKYDDRNNLIKASSSSHKRAVERTYNAFNQITQETVNDGIGQYSLQYAYDRRGRITSIVLPDGSKIKYVYKALFGCKVQRFSPQGKMLYSHTYEDYDSNGKVTSETQIGQVGELKHTYDLNGQETCLETAHFTQNNTYDSLGRLTKLVRKGACQPTKASFTYNDLSQLASESGLTSQTQTYLYDSLDNRQQINKDKLTYNGSNQLLSFSNSRYSYDPQGNLLQKVLDKEIISFKSNALSQIVKIQKADKSNLIFSHDPVGRRLVKKHLGPQNNALSIQRLFYIGNQEIGSLDENGNIVELRIPGLQGGQLSFKSIAMELAGKPYAPLHDINENVIGLVDSKSNKIVESYSYTSFGQETIFNSKGNAIPESALGNPWRYAEKRVDKETGLLFFGVRYYDPQIGRWISPDPIGSLDGPNLYAYLHNNPLNHVDRFGFATENNPCDLCYNYFDERYDVEFCCCCSAADSTGQRYCICKGIHPKNLVDGAVSDHVPLPKVTYQLGFDAAYANYASAEEFMAMLYLCDDMSSFKPYNPPSKLFDLSEEGMFDVPGLGLGFLNGMDNDFKEFKESVRYLSRLAGGKNIHAVYNATHGKDIDLIECKKGRNHIATNPVMLIKKIWDNFFALNRNGRFLMICHSQGAIHVMNALLDYSPALRSQILVVAIAPGGYIYSSTCAQVIHYRAEWWRDLIPRLDWNGAKRESGNTKTLQSHSDAPFHDHSFMSPTYQLKLQEHITYFIDTQGRGI
jgi:RHS repeat-associated protein